MADLIYGFHQLKDILGDRIDEQNVSRINSAVQQAVDEHNRQLNALLSLFVTRTTEYKTRYKQMGATRSQPLDQNGRARPIKSAGYYDIALPIQASGNAWGANYITKQMMTAQDANDATKLLLDGDTAWMADHILAALLGNASWIFPDEEHGNLTVQPLANGDATTYALFTGASSGATDTHYLAQAAAIADAANPFPTILKELREHPENGGQATQVVALVASDLRDDIEALDMFRERPDPNIELGANSDRLTGSLGAEVPGTIIGYVSGVWIAEWPSLPSGYMLSTAVATGRPALAQREYALDVLQGFKLVGQRDDHPFYESQYARWAGFGAWNRVGALVYQVGNATYQIPTGFTSPMP